MDYADKLDMMDDDCDIQGYPLDHIGDANAMVACTACPLDGHCEFVNCKEKEN